MYVPNPTLHLMNARERQRELICEAQRYRVLRKQVEHTAQMPKVRAVQSLIQRVQKRTVRLAWSFPLW